MDKYPELKKKWVYNFIVSPKTNLVEKPEWYLKYTVQWIHEFIDNVEDKRAFILSMLDLVMMRLGNDKFAEDDNILVHTYNEVVSFTRIVRRILGEDIYQATDEKYDLMGVFSTEKIFEKIADAEWACAYTNFKQISRSPNRWDRVLDDRFEDKYNIPKCVDQFLMLIIAIKERAECFRVKDCQLALIELQCSLFDKLLTFLEDSDSVTADVVKLIKIIIKEKHFLPQEQIDNSIISSKIDKLSEGFENLLTLLLEEVE